MKTSNKITEKYQKLIASLDWREKNAATSAVNALAMAQSLGLDRDQAIGLIQSYPSAEYPRTNPHILPQAWTLVGQMCNPDTYMSETDQIFVRA